MPEDSIACFSVVNPALRATISTDLDWIPIEYAMKPQEDGGRILPGRLGGFSSLFVETYNSLLAINPIANKAITFGKKFGAEAVWCVLEGQTLIRLARRVAKGLGVPLLTQVWDPPYWWLREHRVDRLTRNLVLKEFSLALRESACCAAASWAMAEQYAADFGTKTIPVIPSLDASLALPPAVKIHENSELIIGLAGQIYSFQEWNALIAALDSVDWKIADREVKIRLLGRNAHLNTNGKMRVEFFGWSSQVDTIQLMSEADILYCPYWFDPGFESEARLSFPSKLTTYLAAGRPVLFHGPSYASPDIFLQNNNAGICCNTLDKDGIIACITRLISEDGLYARLARNGSVAFQSHLTLESMKENFFRFLEI
jgi:glycosyltransferase involved in cell wall biosynthesis